LWLKVPLIPKLLPACAAWLASKVESSMFAMSPVANVGVGMRKMMLFAARAALKLGCGRLQLPASDLPETVNRSSTPPFGAFGLALTEASGWPAFMPVLLRTPGSVWASAIPGNRSAVRNARTRASFVVFIADLLGLGGAPHPLLVDTLPHSSRIRDCGIPCRM